MKPSAPSILTALCVLLFSLSLRAQTAAPAGGDFATGNAAFEAGKFPEAVAAYQREFHAGRFSANLFYNLADAYYRLGDLGRAIANYDRALLIDPHHAEAAANLAFLRSKIGLHTAVPASLDDQVIAALSVPDVNTYAMVAALSGWLAALGLFLGVFSRRRRALGWVLFGVMVPLLAAAVTILCWLGDGRRDSARAVVVTEQTPARYAPAESAKTIVKLSAGEEVRILTQRGEWTYTQLASGAPAWVAADSIERIIPLGLSAQGSMK